MSTWPVRGYAPGMYSCICGTCGNPFMGDKRARECANCVIIALVTEIDVDPVYLTLKQDLLTEATKVLRECAEDLKTEIERNYPRENATDERRYASLVAPAERGLQLAHKLREVLDPTLPVEVGYIPGPPSPPGPVPEKVG